MHPTTIMRHSEGGSSYQRTSGLASWGAMSLPLEDAVAVGETLAGCDLRPPRDAMLVTPLPAAMCPSLHCWSRPYRRQPPKSSDRSRRCVPVGRRSRPEIANLEARAGRGQIRRIPIVLEGSRRLMQPSATKYLS
jgi:hypothetical protein